MLHCRHIAVYAHCDREGRGEGRGKRGPYPHMGVSEDASLAGRAGRPRPLHLLILQCDFSLFLLCPSSSSDMQHTYCTEQRGERH